eukprot:scaffold64967_cov60-Phaeocystis_antarctica.AAC.2
MPAPTARCGRQTCRRSRWRPGRPCPPCAGRRSGWIARRDWRGLARRGRGRGRGRTVSPRSRAAPQSAPAGLAHR